MNGTDEDRAGDPAREGLDSRVIEWMREESWVRDEDRFASLALKLFTFQFEHCAPYRRLCEKRGVAPRMIARWQDIPTVPSAAFKETALCCFDPTAAARRFQTSGTTQGVPGTLYLDTLEVYEASLRPSFQRHILPDLDELGGRVRMRILAPSPGEAPHSSLSHMFGVALSEWGDADSGFDVAGGELQLGTLQTALGQAINCDTPTLLCGTSFAFVHLLDALSAQEIRMALPGGSRIMETGGYKGRSREIPRDELARDLSDRLGVPESRILNQYGMTELGSQFYDSTLRDPEGPRRKLAPPWTRVRILDPETMDEVEPGGTGLVAIYDLANTGSVLALQTADIARRVCDGFQLIGRATEAEARGCSIGADILLGEGAKR